MQLDLEEALMTSNATVYSAAPPPVQDEIERDLNDLLRIKGVDCWVRVRNPLSADHNEGEVVVHGMPSTGDIRDGFKLVDQINEAVKAYDLRGAVEFYQNRDRWPAEREARKGAVG